MGVTLPGHILLCFLCFLQIGSQGELELYRKATSLSPPPAPSHGPIKERPVSAMLDDRQDF